MMYRENKLLTGSCIRNFAIIMLSLNITFAKFACSEKNEYAKTAQEDHPAVGRL